jgi:hypothetical protein
MENNEILSHCEKNEISLKIFDVDNDKFQEEIFKKIKMRFFINKISQKKIKKFKKSYL